MHNIYRIQPFPEKNEIRPDGLRYTSKASGSSFSTAPGGTLSCFGCGKFVPRSQGLLHRLLGKNEFFCSDVCRQDTLYPNKEAA